MRLRNHLAAFTKIKINNFYRAHNFKINRNKQKDKKKSSNKYSNKCGLILHYRQTNFSIASRFFFHFYYFDLTKNFKKITKK